MKITIYTITECPFSKQEREYLSSHGLTFEEKNLEINREFLSEMLAVGSNFAGTPVTKIEKDDGQIVVLKGFTVADFDKTLGFEQVAKPEQATPGEAPQAVPEVATMPLVEVTPAIEVPEAQPVGAPAPVPEAPVAATPVVDPAFASILNNLEQQAQVPEEAPISAFPAAPAPPPVDPMPAAPVSGQPVIPDPQF